MNKKSSFIFIPALTLLAFYFVAQIGTCGIGPYNKFPFELKSNFSNGFWIADEYGFGILHESYDAGHSLFDGVDIKNIERISYSKTILYAQVETHDGRTLYAIIDELEPTWEKVKFIKEGDFYKKFSSEENWINPTSFICRSGHFVDDLIFILKSLLVSDGA